MTLFSSPQRRACLGVALGGREVAVAVVSTTKDSSHLPAHVVGRLRRLHTPEERDRAFKRHVERHLERFPVDAVCAVLHDPASSDVLRQLRILEEVCRRLALPLVRQSNAIVREALVPRPGRTTNRDLGLVLRERVPQLAALVPDHLTRGDPAALARIPDAQERYWFRLCMAIAGALYALDEGLPTATPAV